MSEATALKDLREALARAQRAEARVAELVEALRRAAHELDQWVLADGTASYRVERAEAIIAAALAHEKEKHWRPGDSIGFQMIDGEVTVWKRDGGNEWRLATGQEIATAPVAHEEEKP